jgi:hypothetical protein
MLVLLSRLTGKLQNIPEAHNFMVIGASFFLAGLK